MNLFASFLQRTSRVTKPAVCLFAALALFTPRAQSANTDRNIDQRADQWLHRMGDYLQHAKYFSFNADIWQDVQLSSGQQVQAARTLAFNVRRPDRLRVEVRSTRRNRQLIYDGHDITLLNRVQNFYGTVAVPGSLDKALDAAVERFGINMPLEDFLHSDPYHDLTERVQSGIDIGPTTVLGTPCEHLAFTQGNIDWQVWVETGPRPVPKKFLITYKDEPGTPEFTAIFNKWDFSTPLPDFVFNFEPPPGASKIPVKEVAASVQPQHTTEAK
jgi:hypothetical protein